MNTKNEFDREFSGDKERSNDEIYSKSVRAGKRTYFFDVKATKRNDYYITITESKRLANDNGTFSYEKHKIFLYSEDFDKFVESLNEVLDYVRNNSGGSSFTSRDSSSSSITFESLDD